MNGSQLLYQIQDLQYRIRRKEGEYKGALEAGDLAGTDLHHSALGSMKEELAVKVKAFNSIPPPDVNTASNPLKKKSWWKQFFKTKVVFKK